MDCAQYDEQMDNNYIHDSRFSTINSEPEPEDNDKKDFDDYPQPGDAQISPIVTKVSQMGLLKKVVTNVNG